MGWLYHGDEKWHLTGEMIKITWLGHSAFELKFETGEVLLFDPWVDGNPKLPKNYPIERADVIALSHAHSDHFNGVVPLAKKLGSKIIAIFETATWLQKQGIENAVPVNKGGTVDLGFASLTMTHAIHSCSIQDNDNLIYGGEAAGFVVKDKGGRSAYFAGDTTAFSDMALIPHLHSPELAFLPIGDHFTMGPHEAAHAARMLKVKTVIPMHYGTFPVLTGTPEQLEQKLSGDGIKVWELEPGKTVEW
jgi:L-ascorbate metabolism protein UlaG (beta-lactamase superfamily)